MNDACRSAFAGLLATIPMTITMRFLQSRLPARERYPLPPRQITANAARRVGALHHLDQESLTALTAVAHFGYGTAIAMPYALLDPVPVRPAAKGAAYGMLVWGASYLELLPRLDLLAPATRHPARRTALMITAHLIWGVSLATSFEGLKSLSSRTQVRKRQRRHPREFLDGSRPRIV